MAISILGWTLVFLLAAEFVVAVIAPLVVPNSAYLRLYLGRQALASTRTLLANAHPYLVWDAVTGWRNRPNTSRSLWRVDSRGARVSSAPHRPGRRQVMFLGDSVTNGGVGVSNDETISAFVEDDLTESLNFATMLYCMDQVYLSLKEQLRNARPSVIVVGLSDTGDGLGNRYIPFRRRNENNMPFLKPRYRIDSGELTLIPLPPARAYDDLLGEGRILTELAATDDFYEKFTTYHRCGFLPLSGLACAAREKYISATAAVRREMPYSPLLTALIREVVGEGAKRGAETVFILHPTAAATQPLFWRKWLPDQYAGLLSSLRASGFIVLDARDALRRSGESTGRLFAPDGIHYRAEGNRVIARALRPILGRYVRSSSSSRLSGNMGLPLDMVVSPHSVFAGARVRR